MTTTTRDYSRPKKAFKAHPKLQYRMTVHSDQGIQYQFNVYRDELRKHGVFQSMSRRAYLS